MLDYNIGRFSNDTEALNSYEGTRGPDAKLPSFAHPIDARPHSQPRCACDHMPLRRSFATWNPHRETQLLV
jgi:hypothetical protein